MYLPKSIYRFAPQYWFIVGALLVLLGVRVGSEGSQVFQYFSIALGALSCIWGASIFFMRRSQRQMEAAETSTD